MLTNSTSGPFSYFPSLETEEDDVLDLKGEILLETIFMYVTLFLAPIGLVANVLNIKTFLAIGIGDGVSVSLFAISLADFGVCFVGTLHAFAFFTHKATINNGIAFDMDTMVVATFFIILRKPFYAMTSMTTTFLAVARCMCVAKPLQFKNTFTRYRSVIIHICFAAISASGYIAILTQMGAKEAFDEQFNRTRYLPWFSKMREQIKDVVFFVYDVFSTFTTQVILIVCVVIMADTLRESGKFRESTKSGPVESDKGNHEKQSFKLSGKELQVIQQVVLISVMCIVCALPKIYAAIYTLVEPEFDFGKQLHRDYMGAVHIRLNLELINSATTFLIYYRYNTKFRSLCFGRKAGNK